MPAISDIIDILPGTLKKSMDAIEANQNAFALGLAAYQQAIENTPSPKRGSPLFLGGGGSSSKKSPSSGGRLRGIALIEDSPVRTQAQQQRDNADETVRQLSIRLQTTERETLQLRNDLAAANEALVTANNKIAAANEAVRQARRDTDALRNICEDRDKKWNEAWESGVYPWAEVEEQGEEAMDDGVLELTQGINNL
jgi:hypothetical protein